LSPAEEKAEYDLHRNSPDDVGYRRFLSRTVEPLAARLAPASNGLDFGCGPGPTLSVMLEEAGHQVALYDPFYANDQSVFKRQYDFITATEVVEHLRRPGEELARLWACLAPGGFLAVMTKRVINRQAFARWHYKADRTHICFFSAQTFEWLAKQWQAGLVFEGKDVAILEKVRPGLSPAVDNGSLVK
jgi:2-polyprenyl-3-methyl-5-hydroxy-6-metoxy-1,4-benzoquinol methylase